MLASTRGAPRTPPPTASDQRALQPLVQLHGQHGGKDDLDGVAGQVGQDAPAKGADEVSPGQDHEPDRAQHVASGTAHDHRHAERPELAAQRLRQQGRQQRGQNVADGVAAGLAEEYRRAAVDAVRKLSQDVGIPADLKEIVRPEDVPFLAQSAYDDACRPGNPRDTSVEEIKELYRSLM